MAQETRKTPTRKGSTAKGGTAKGPAGARAAAKGKGGAKVAGKGAARGRGRGKAEAHMPDGAGWGWAALAMIAAVTALRIAWNAAEPIPVHFDEAQYWAYGQELAWGYFSKPPLVGAVIRLFTDIGADTLFWMRLASPLAHGLVAGCLYLLGAGMFGRATGFWASAAYMAAPGVSVSAMIMSTDPVMMAFWALAMLAWLRAIRTGALSDWALMGAAIGLGALAKYTMLAMPAAALGYGLFSARGRDLKGAAVAMGAALLVLAPNLAWNAAHDFATVTHVAEDADPGHGYLNPLKLAEFLGAQFGVIGPVVFLAILAAFWHRRDWREDWRMRLLAWQTGALLFAIVALSFLTRAQPNWAAPAYVAGCLFAAAWARQYLDHRRWWRALGVQAAVGVVAAGALMGAAHLYETRAEALPRWGDPFKKMRISEPFCDRALASMFEEGAQVLLADNRRRLSECMFLGSLTWDEVAVWNPELLPENHHELVATLREGDQREMLLAVMQGGEEIAARFAEARLVDKGEFRTHGDRRYPYELWILRDFEGYGLTYE